MREINFTGRKTMRGFPRLKKSGAILGNNGEATPFVWRDRLLLLQNLWSGIGETPGPCGLIADYFTGETLSSPIGGDGCRFYSAYSENDRVSVFAAHDNKVYRYESGDLQNWIRRTAVEFPDNFELFNTSVCRGDGKYMMAVEAAWAGQGSGDQENKIGNPYIGVYYTEFFAESADLENWTVLPFEKCYTKARYCACPALRYTGGYYYMICLEELPLTHYAPYIYRTKDFETWEIGLYNPILLASEEDRTVKKGVILPEDIVRLNETMVDINNSDVDLCEYKGKTYVVYCSGNQGITREFNGLVCEAVYDGPMSELLEAYFE